MRAMNSKKEKQSINLVLGSDQGYFDGLYATLTSLFLNTNTTKHLNIYIFDGGINTTIKISSKITARNINISENLFFTI